MEVKSWPTDVLVAPTRPVPRLTDLSTSELTSLITAVQHVGRVIESVYEADGLTVACQVLPFRVRDIKLNYFIKDGKAAGQTIPHVHFHLLPRKFQGDAFAGRNDGIYRELERVQGSLACDLHSQAGLKHDPLRVDADDNRPPRTLEEMEKEAMFLRGFFDVQAQE
jgi:bis(5'-adenosyl)-triphosphatase